MPADLHIHSNASDGVNTPTQIIELARAYGLNTISITDHDTIEGIEEAISASGVLEIIPGVEISCLLGDKDIHIIGYFIDYKSGLLTEELEKLNKMRVRRAYDMASLLQKEGLMITYEDIASEAYPASPGRAHVARLLLEKGLVRNTDEAFDKYLKNGRCCYVPKTGATAAQCIGLIHKTGGLAILAHAGPSQITPGEINDLKEAGLDGLEVFHPEHKHPIIKYLLKVCKKEGFLITGGSDFHGPYREGPVVFLGIDDNYVLKLKAALG